MQLLTVGNSKPEAVLLPSPSPILPAGTPEILINGASSEKCLGHRTSPISSVITSTNSSFTSSPVTNLVLGEVASDTTSSHHAAIMSHSAKEALHLPPRPLSFASFRALRTSTPTMTASSTITSPTVLSTTIESIRISPSPPIHVEPYSRSSCFFRPISPAGSSNHSVPINFFGGEWYPEPEFNRTPSFSQSPLPNIPFSLSALPLPLLPPGVQVLCWDPLQRRPSHCDHCRKYEDSQKQLVMRLLRARVEVSQNNMGILYQDLQARTDKSYQSSLDLTQQLKIDTAQKLRKIAADRKLAKERRKSGSS